MTATARVLNITPEQIESAGGGQGGAYAALEVPGDYVAVLKDVVDFDNREKGGAVGWKFIYDVEGLAFTEHIGLGESARWKLLDTFEAHGFPLGAGQAKVDPLQLVGTEVAARIDFPAAYYKASPDEQARGKWYREIRYVFALPPDEAPEEIFGTDAGQDTEVSQLDARVEAEEPEVF